MSVALASEPAVVDLLPDRRRLGLRLALFAAVLAGVAIAIGSVPGLGEIRDRLTDAAPGWLAAALALQIGSCVAFVVAFRGVYGRRLPWRLSYDVAMAAQGTNALLPAGGASGLALGGWALTRTGMPIAHVARRTVALYVLTSSVNFLTAALAGGLLALGILAGGESLALTGGPALLAVLSIAAALTLPRRLLAGTRERRREGRIGRLLSSGSAALGGGIDDARGLVRSRNPLAVGGAIAYMTFDLAALGAAFAAIGDLPPVGVLMLAYVIGQLGGLIPLPGGIGGADGGLIAALVLYGTPLATAAAAVLAYRAFQLGLPALLGAVAIVRLPGALRRARDVASLCEPLPDGAPLRGPGGQSHSAGRRIAWSSRWPTSRRWPDAACARGRAPPDPRFARRVATCAERERSCARAPPQQALRLSARALTPPRRRSAARPYDELPRWLTRSRARVPRAPASAGRGGSRASASPPSASRVRAGACRGCRARHGDGACGCGSSPCSCSTSCSARSSRPARTGASTSPIRSSARRSAPAT